MSSILDDTVDLYDAEEEEKPREKRHFWYFLSSQTYQSQQGWHSRAVVPSSVFAGHVPLELVWVLI
jgi:hypothetical protein